MKIGYDAKYLWQGKKHSAKTGHGVHALELLRHLMLVDSENEYSVYLIEEYPDLPFNKNFHPTLLNPSAQSSILRNLYAYPIELLRNPVDLLFSFTAIPCFTRCKTVLHFADIFWIAHPEWTPKGYSIPITLSTKSSAKKADKIITTTEFSKKEIMHHLNVPEKKIEVVPHGVRNVFKKKVPPERIKQVKDRHGIQGEYILSINDIHPRKNLHGLVDAFFQLKDKYQIPHKLVFVGRSLLPYPEFFGKIENSRHKADVIFPGYVATDEIGPLYHGASLFVYASFYEGWGLQVHEAMSAGVPVAVSHKSTMVEIGGGAVVEFDPHNSADMSEAIYRVLDSSTLQEEMIRKGLAQVEKFTWEDTARQFLEIFKKVV